MFSAFSSSPARTVASASLRSSSALIDSDIATLAVPAVCVPTAVELLRALELDEALDLFLCRGAEGPQLPEDRLRTIALVEELAEAEVERAQDLEQRIQPDVLLALLHAPAVALTNSELVPGLDPL